MKQFVLFDHDGVLVDTEGWYFEAGRRALAEVGLELTQEQYLHDMAAGRGTWVLAREAGVDEATIDHLRLRRDEAYQHFLRTEAIEVEGVLEALRELSSLVRMAIVTTAKRSDFELIHADRDVVPFMDFVLVRDDYEHAKPHPEPYLTALARFDARPEETLVVEDSARGLQSAVAAGIDCAVVHHAFTASQDFAGATYRIATLAELVDLVRSS